MVKIGRQPLLLKTSNLAEVTQQYVIYQGIGAFLSNYKGPVLVLNSDTVRAKVQELQHLLPRGILHYAPQANSHPAIVKALQEEGAGFAAQSTAEIQQLLDVGVKAESIDYIQPIKSRAQIEFAAARGISWFVIDSLEELRKITYIKPDAKLYLRIDTPALGHPASSPVKYGAAIAETPMIIQEAVKKGVDLAGVAFHAGSQCLQPENWQIGIARAKLILHEMRRAGLKPRRLNIGGGFPVTSVTSAPSMEHYAKIINQALTGLDPNIDVIVEPGRYLVAEAGMLLGQVIGIAQRDGQRWLYLDMPLSKNWINQDGQLGMPINTDRGGPLAPWTLVGENCNDNDIPIRDVMLPRYLQEGDYVYFYKAGAYTFDGQPVMHASTVPSIKVIGSGPCMKILSSD